jgi:hypothetical protein
MEDWPLGTDGPEVNAAEARYGSTCIARTASIFLLAFSSELRDGTSTVSPKLPGAQPDKMSQKLNACATNDPLERSRCGMAPSPNTGRPAV